MNDRRDMCRALPSRLGLLLLVVVAFVNGCASGDAAEQPVDASSDATDDLQSRDARLVYSCTLAQGLILAALEVFTSDGDTPTCRILASEPPNASRGFCFPAPPLPGTCPDCLALKETLGCAIMP
ncbi:hypothetical protein [Polyangium mundeleinium]|uniref:Lipoprotein n=1 Tax=Polyangium mundeleinium TaxID=2995306 RepID=A0ABT5ELT8_9BACT|nr:hypothetical protein [Polyangium mundeleinium]MDC0742789.1 hypothetical protein [Polyangium mundeleinium]